MDVIEEALHDIRTLRLMTDYRLMLQALKVVRREAAFKKLSPQTRELVDEAITAAD